MGSGDLLLPSPDGAVSGSHLYSAVHRTDLVATSIRTIARWLNVLGM